MLTPRPARRAFPLLFVVAALLAAGSTACGSSEEEAESPAPEPPAAEAQEAAEPAEPAEPAKPAEPAEPAAADPVTTATDFYFSWDAGSGAAFGERILVDAQGHLTWLAMPRAGAQPNEIHALHVDLDAEEQRRFRAAVAAAGLFSLDPLYRDPGVNDGSQLTVRVRAGGREHRIECDNLVPPSIEGLRPAVAALTRSEARRQALAVAPIAGPGDLRAQTPVAP